MIRNNTLIVYISYYLFMTYLFNAIVSLVLLLTYCFVLTQTI